MSSKETKESKETNKLLEQLRDLMVLQLRQAKVPTEAIGRALGISAKSVRNQYPLGKAKGEVEEEKPQEVQGSDSPQSSSP
jgi:hypothetical protein